MQITEMNPNPKDLYHFARSGSKILLSDPNPSPAPNLLHKKQKPFLKGLFNSSTRFSTYQNILDHKKIMEQPGPQN